MSASYAPNLSHVGVSCFDIDKMIDFYTGVFGMCLTDKGPGHTFPFLLALRKSRQVIFLGLSILALIIGSVFLFRTPEGKPAINPFVAILTSGLAGGFMWFVARKGLAALGLRALNNREALEGAIGEARTDIRGEGTVYAGGEEWTARSSEFIALGSKVRIIGRDGLVLLVEAEHPHAQE